MSAAGADADEPDRVIYLSRPRGGWRSVLNDDEISDWFRSEGHDVLQPHRAPLADQIRRFSKASLIVGLHGAGLTNILFAPHAALLELTGAYGDGLYFGMTARLGQSYEALSCKPVGDDVVVDLEVVKTRIARSQARYPATGALAHG
jgi:capsular polysaccharide biosynthesis protein